MSTKNNKVALTVVDPRKVSTNDPSILSFRVPSAGGGFATALVTLEELRRYLLSIGLESVYNDVAAGNMYSTPEVLAYIRDRAKNLSPERFAEPTENILNNIFFGGSAIGRLLATAPMAQVASTGASTGASSLSPKPSSAGGGLGLLRLQTITGYGSGPQVSMATTSTAMKALPMAVAGTLGSMLVGKMIENAMRSNSPAYLASEEAGGSDDTTATNTTNTTNSSGAATPEPEDPKKKNSVKEKINNAKEAVKEDVKNKVSTTKRFLNNYVKPFGGYDQGSWQGNILFRPLRDGLYINNAPGVVGNLFDVDFGPWTHPVTNLLNKVGVKKTSKSDSVDSPTKSNLPLGFRPIAGFSNTDPNQVVTYGSSGQPDSVVILQPDPDISRFKGND